MTGEQLYALSLPYPGREDRLVRVFVPAHEEGEKLPVVYMTDGQNLFDRESSGFGCWYTREAVRAEREKSGKAAIIVGVHNPDPWRSSELTPASIGEIRCPEELREQFRPMGEEFDAFLTDCLIPAVEERFPAERGRAAAAICGSSSGGLQAFFTALSHPDRFCAAGVLSPAFLLYSREDMDRWIHRVMSPEPPFLYLYTGDGDPLERDIAESVRWTEDKLRDCWPEDRLHSLFLPGARHHETAWEGVFRDFLHLFLTRG